MNKQSALKLIYEFIKSLITSLVIVLLLTNFVLKPIKVNGSSMFPTLRDQALGFSNILAFQMFGVDRFDVVIVYVDAMDEYLVKRVIGLPLETIEMRKDVLYINDVPFEERFIDVDYAAQITTPTRPFTLDFGPITLAEDEVFLMGDNRPFSSDSRMFGPFKLNKILSKDVYIFFPFNQVRWLSGVR
jgi:signal peptidase I